MTDRHTQPPDLAPPPPEAPPRPGPEAVPPPPPPPAEPDPTGGGDEPPRPQFEPISRHAPRFRLILGALIGVTVGAIAATLVLVSGQGPSIGSGNWSQWQPSSSSLGDGAQQIADHVAPTYRQQGGDQLVGVTGGPLKVAASPDPLPAKIAVATQDTTKIGIVRGSTALYSLCGLGSRCSINRGKASAQRLLLLQREALELALYSFKYLDANNVVALLPPAPGQKPQNAVFFQRNEFKKALDTPIAQVLPSPPPSMTGLTTSPQGRLISRVTTPSLYCFSFQQAQDLSAFLVLQKPALNTKRPCAQALTTGSATPQPSTSSSSSSGTTTNG
ncbi:MAG TPA: hypothetical protein VGN78_10170 [Solirubrobacteraceae bacterium]|nr:hypothetical protein [Solirubrobacteraceae bacterium]